MVHDKHYRCKMNKNKLETSSGSKLSVAWFLLSTLNSIGRKELPHASCHDKGLNKS